jgi:hypothetical protein
MTGGESRFAKFWALFGTGEEIAAKLMEAWENLKGAFNDLMEAFSTGDWSVIKERFKAGFEQVKQIIEDALSAAVDFFEDYFGISLDNIVKEFERIFGGITDIFQGILNLVVNLWNGEFEKIPGNIMQILEGLGGLLFGQFGVMLNSILALFAWIFERIKNKVTGVFTALTDAIYDKFNEAGQKIKGVWEGIVGWFSEKIEWFTNKAKAIKNFFGFGESNDEGGNPQGYEQPAPSGMGPNGNGALPVPQAGSGLPPAGGGDTNVSTETNIGTVNVNTQATDAEGIAKDMSDAVRKEEEARANAKKVSHANSGVQWKRG